MLKYKNSHNYGLDYQIFKILGKNKSKKNFFIFISMIIALP